MHWDETGFGRFRLYFAYHGSAMSMHYINQGKRTPTTFVVTCKRCERSVPAGVEVYPKDNLTHRCPLCGELRRFRPSEVYLGFPDPALATQQASFRRKLRRT